MTVVTGATGRTGRRVVETLLAKDERVRAIGRDATRLVPLAKLGAEAFVGNAEDAASMTAAFDGTSGVYLVLPEDLSQPDLRAHQERFRFVCGGLRCAKATRNNLVKMGPWCIRGATPGE